MTRIRATVVIWIITAATISVIQAAAGIAVPFYSAEELGHRARVADRADLYFLDGLVRDGQCLWDAVELADQGDPAGQDVIGGPADTLDSRQDPVEQEDHDGQYHHQQDGVPDPPQSHDRFSSARGLVGD